MKKFLCLKKIIGILSFLIIFTNGFSAIRYWTNNYGGGNFLWNTATNWEDEFSTNGVPAAGDSVVFDGATYTTDNCTLDVATASLLAINIVSGYTGIFVQDGFSVTTTGTFTIADGTFEGGTAGVIIGGYFTQTGGVFQTSSGNINFDGAVFESSGGTFTATTGTQLFRIVSGGSDKTIKNTRSFNNLTFRNQSGSNKIITIEDVATGITVAGTLSILGTAVGAGVTINTGSIHAQGAVTFGGSAITSSGGTATIYVDGTSDQNITTSTTADNTKNFPNVIINKSSGTAILVASSRLNTTGDFTIQGGTLRIVDQLVDGDGGASDDFTVQSGGTLEYSTATINAATGFNSNTYSSGSTVSYTLAGNQTILDLDYSNLTLATSGAKALPATSTVTVGATLTISGTATLDMNTNAEDISIFSLDDNHATDGITESATNSITFTGSSAATIDVTGSVDYGDVVFSNTVGTRINTVTGSLLFNDVTISATGILDPDANDFSLDGDWTNNNGTAGFTPSANQAVTFTGATARSVGGSGSTAFQDLTCSLSGAADPDHDLTISTACEVFGVLDVSDGQIVTGGLLTLNSEDVSSRGTAAIANLSDGTPEATPIFGDVIVERFINEGGPEYYMLASPLTDADFEDWNQEFFMSGFTGTNDVSNSFKSVITRNEAAETWPNPSNTTDIIANGTGYMAYIGNDGIGTNLPKTLNITGTVKTGGLTLSSLTNTNNQASTSNNDGWWLLGNPYASPIIWDNVAGNAGTTNINATAMRKLSNGSYAAIPGGGIIASGEAFWVFAEDAFPDGSVEFQENDKSPTTADSYNTKHGGTPLSFNIVLKQGTYEDSPAEVILTNEHLSIPTSVGYDPILDAAKKSNQQGKENIATLISNNTTGGYIRNYIPDTISQLTIPVRVWKASPANVTKTYTLEFKNVAALNNNNKCLSFEDTYAGISFPLLTDTSYSVSMKDTTFVPRFFIHISSPITSTVTSIGCNGSAQGLITAAGNGSGPFNYIWKNQAGDTIQNVTSSNPDSLDNLEAGIYFLTVSNNGSCGTVSTHFEITNPDVITLSSVKTDVACYGDSSGTAELTVSGGNSPYSYSWSNGQSQYQISNLISQTYYVTLTDAGGCSKIDSVTISQPTQISINPASVNITCFGDANGSAATFVSGGNSPYTYSWSNGGTGSQITNLPSQVYYVTVSDIGNCSKIDSVEVTQPDNISILSSTNNATCYGTPDGTASVSVSGGISGYSYLWSNGETQALISNLSPQKYYVTVTDANNCTKTDSVTINQPSAISIIPSSGDVLCYGGNDGIASVSVSGGNSGYTYLWSSGGTGSAESSLSVGNYTVTVTDNSNCSSTSSFIISQPDSISLNLSSSNAECNGGNEGQAFVIAMGGVSNYSYLWTSGGISASETGLGAGTHSVTVTDNNNCFATASVVISEPDPILISSTSTDATCSNSNGSAAISASGGTGSLLYNWSNGNQTESISSVTAGNYTVTVTDGNSCTKTSSVIINNIDGPTLTIAGTSDVSCSGGNDGSAMINISGGTSPYSFLWDNGFTSQNISSVEAGTYFISVTDNNNCITILSATINQPDPLQLNISSDNITCFGANDGQTAVLVSGGTSGYSYLWSNGSTLSQINNLGPQTYSVTITDNNGCTAMANSMIAEPSILVAGLSSVSLTCNNSNDGQALASVSGGVSPYTYLWNNGSQTQNLTSLSSGNYFVTVTDFNNCSTASTVTISEPSPLVVNMSSTDIKCFGNTDGKAGVLPEGGTSPYTFNWSNGSNQDQLTNLAAQSYSVTVSDNNNCISVSSVAINSPLALSGSVATTDATCGKNDGSILLSASGGTGNLSYLWNNGNTSQNLTSISAGSYSVDVTDENGCTINIAASLNNINGPTSTISLIENVSCNGGNNGQAGVSVSGGTPGYSILWSNGSIDSIATNLSAGNYSVSVTDNNGCVGISSVTIDEPASISISATSSDATCGSANGSASVSSSGGTGNHSYFWSTGDTTGNISNVVSGNYTLTITDENNCEVIATVIVNNIDGPLVSVLSSTDVSCFGGSNGQVTTNSTGGTSPYSYSWSNGSVLPSISGLAEGNYTLTVTDLNNCTGIISTVISQPSSIIITSNVTNALCGNPDGTASVTVSGGTGGYSYSWSNGESTPAIGNLSAGNYYILVTDANGCTKMATVIISNTAGPGVNISSVNEPSCFGNSDGEATGTANGSSPFTFLWQNSLGDTLKLSNGISGSDLFQNIPAGEYSLFVTDNNGCGNSVLFSISQPEEVIALFLTGADTIDINNGGNINLTNSSSGANSYSWNFGDGSSSTQFEPNHIYGLTGTFTISLTASLGQCSDSYQKEVVVINSVGITEINNAGSFKVFQTGNTAVLIYNFSKPESLEMGLYNILGQNIHSKKLLLFQSGRLEIKLPEATGIYFLKITGKSQEVVLKMYR